MAQRQRHWRNRIMTNCMSWSGRITLLIIYWHLVVKVLNCVTHIYWDLGTEPSLVCRGVTRCRATFKKFVWQDFGYLVYRHTLICLSYGRWGRWRGGGMTVGGQTRTVTWALEDDAKVKTARDAVDVQKKGTRGAGLPLFTPQRPGVWGRTGAGLAPRPVSVPIVLFLHERLGMSENSCKHSVTWNQQSWVISWTSKCRWPMPKVKIFQTNTKLQVI